MTIISKQLFESFDTSNYNCQDVCHPEFNSCYKGFLNAVLTTAYGSSRFFLAIYLLQTIINWKKVNKIFLKKKFKDYFRSIAYCMCYTGFTIGSGCLVRSVSKFHYYNMLFSGLCAGLAIFVESEENRRLDTAIYANLVVETWFRYSYFFKLVTRSTIFESLIFMTCSAALMYKLKLRKTKGPVNLWKVIEFFLFYYPTSLALKEPTTADVCSHKTPCDQYIQKGFLKYFALGYILQLLKQLVPQLHKTIFTPKKLLQLIFSKDKILFGLVLGSYVGIYRFICCLLRKQDKMEKPEHSLVAGFVAGAAYAFKPTLPLLSIITTASLQIVLQELSFIKACNSLIPTREFVYIICSGLLVHYRGYYEDICPRYLTSMLDAITMGKVSVMHKNAMLIYEHLAALKSQAAFC